MIYLQLQDNLTVRNEGRKGSREKGKEIPTLGSRLKKVDYTPGFQTAASQT
jgi:hypothetical protein